MQKIQFWNGNKSVIRADYERQILQACLEVTTPQWGNFDLIIDNTDYPAAIDESNIFLNGADVLVTVLDNPKFAKRDKIIVEHVIDKGMLGFRAILCCEEMSSRLVRCENSKELRGFQVGIPATWVDAELFRFNEFSVVEDGSLDDLFVRMGNGQFAWTSLGMNEVEAVLNEFPEAAKDVIILPELMLYYPLLLVFYVTPEKPELANRLQAGLKLINENSQLDAVFKAQYGTIVDGLNLKERTIFTLENPDIKGPLKSYKPEIFD